jgi:hypothetical protein
VIVARTTLWIMLAAPSVAAVVWLNRTGPRELTHRLRDAPKAIRDCPRLAYVAGAGLGAALAVAGIVLVLSV